MALWVASVPAEMLSINQSFSSNFKNLIFFSSLGYTFHIGSQLKGDVSSIFERIEDAIVQADEVDGIMLQFEGGLSITGKESQSGMDSNIKLFLLQKSII